MKPIASRSALLVVFSILCGIAALIFCSSLSIPLKADPPAKSDQDAAKKAIRARYDQSIELLQKKDAAGYVRLLTDDFEAKGPNNLTMSRAQYEQALKVELPAMKGIKITNQIHSIEVKGDKATVTATQKTKATVTLQGSDHALDSTQEVKDSWVKTSSGWKLKREEVLKDTELIDGKARN